MSGEEIRTVAAVLAVAISVVSLVITRMQARRADRLGRRPVLVVRSDKQRTKWEIENIGKGPAVDVVILKCAAGAWLALQLPDLSADGTAALPTRWLKEDYANLLCATSASRPTNGMQRGTTMTVRCSRTTGRDSRGPHRQSLTLTTGPDVSRGVRLARALPGFSTSTSAECDCASELTPAAARMEDTEQPGARRERSYAR